MEAVVDGIGGVPLSSTPTADLPATFAGCHGIAIDPSPAGPPTDGSEVDDGYGTTRGQPNARLAVSADLPHVAFDPVGATRLWERAVATGHLVPSAPVDRPTAATIAYAMWRDGTGALVLTIDGRQVLWVAADRTRAATGSLGTAAVHQLISTFAAPLAAQTAGSFVLHAAAAVREGQAVVVCADSGTGKSSLTTALADAGWSPLSEDLVAIDLGGDHGPVAWPGPPWVRLRPGLPGPTGAAERFRTVDKVAWDLAPGQCAEPVPVALVVFLEPAHDGPTEYTPIAPTAAIGAIAHHAPWHEEPATDRPPSSHPPSAWPGRCPRSSCGCSAPNAGGPTASRPSRSCWRLPSSPISRPRPSDRRPRTPRR